MNSDADGVEVQLRQLLQVVERHRDERRHELLGQAQREAERVIREAHAEARARMHRCIQSIREERHGRLAASEAKLQTHRRRRREGADLWLLAAAWQPLRKALLARWSLATARRQWIELLVNQARALLVATDWQIEHPVDWPAPERTALEERLTGQLGCAPEFIPCEDIKAGLRVCADGTCVDATVEGLLRDETRIEALLLARFNAGAADEG
jgi:hypothetical protein